MKPKLQRVCNSVLSGKSMREALIEAGYSDSYASHNSTKFLHNREVQRYIRERQRQIEEAALADDIFLITNLKSVINDPNAALTEKIESRKLLEKILTRFDELKMRAMEIEAKKLEVPEKQEQKQINITISEAKKPD